MSLLESMDDPACDVLAYALALRAVLDRKQAEVGRLQRVVGDFLAQAVMAQGAQHRASPGAGRNTAAAAARRR